MCLLSQIHLSKRDHMTLKITMPEFIKKIDSGTIRPDELQMVKDMIPALLKAPISSFDHQRGKALEELFDQLSK